MEGQGKVHVSKAPDFKLRDQNGELVTLRGLLDKGPVALAFYPGDFTPSCVKQLCNYRDNIEDFKKLGVQVCGISADPPESHREFMQQHGFPFPLLSDPGNVTAKAYGCSSFLLFGGVSRAIFIVNRLGSVLYRYIEPTTLTSRKAVEVIGIVNDLRKHGLI